VTQPTEVLGKTAGKDLTAEKATYPAFYGIEETRARAEKVYGEAIDELNRLARPTGILREIAAFILDRES
jgi:geranylgeranyl diphosphate synthase type II